MKLVSMSSVGWTKAMRDVFMQHGLDAERLFAEAGVARECAGTVGPGELSDAFNRAWELAIAKTGNEAIGLTMPTHPLAPLGVLSHVLLALADLRSVLFGLARFARLASPTASIEPKIVGDRCRVHLHIIPGRFPVLPQRYDCLGMTCMRGLYWLTGRRTLPSLSFHRPGPVPAQPERWREAFGCPVVFGAAACWFDVAVADLTLPIPTADRTVSDLCERIAAQASAQQCGSISARVREVLVTQLSKGDPRREAVASALCMSERTLQRRLAEEGTSFAELVDQVRREAAERYFAHSGYSATEITFALGFSDPSNFYRACKRWFGRPPSTMRPN